MGNPISAVFDATGIPVLIDAQQQPDGAYALRVVDTSAAGSTPASAGATTTPALGTTVSTVLAANSARKGATVYNSSTLANAFLSLGGSATLSSFTVKLVPGAYYELPYAFVGSVTAIGDAAGTLTVSELT